MIGKDDHQIRRIDGRDGSSESIKRGGSGLILDC